MLVTKPKRKFSPDTGNKEKSEVKRLSLFAVAVLALFASCLPTWAQLSEKTFDLAVNSKFVDCLGVPYGPQPTATVTLQRGNLDRKSVV